MKVLTVEDVDQAGLADWRMLYGRLQARFATGDFASGIALADRIAAAADAVDHHPDLNLTYPRLLVSLWSHDVGGVSSRDLDLARTISTFAAEAGIEAEPDRLSDVEVALDVADIDAVRPFWAAVLGVTDPGEGDEIADPDGVFPTLWFQRREPSDTVPPQRFHYDIRVPRNQAQRRIDAALAAGGTLVSGASTPAFVIVADPEGNNACICTSYGRTEEH